MPDLQNRPIGIKPQWNRNLTIPRMKLVIMNIPQLIYFGETLTHVHQKHIKGMFTEVEENKSWKESK